MQGGRRTFVKPDPVVQVLELPCGVWRGQVLRGYVGDRSSKPVYKGRTPFDILGPGYQRPFELATLRLSNMIGILPRCGQPPSATLSARFVLSRPVRTLCVSCGMPNSAGSCAGGELCPEQTALLTQQGGCLVFKGKEVIYRHDDSGILMHTDCDALLNALHLASV